MGKCNIDHSLEDVFKKLENQKNFLPNQIYQELLLFLEKEQTQETLNDVFHLLKKYDLALESERVERNKRMEILIKG